ncbi:hypothetical protein FQA39_LY19163 [Lamprigera yunnana]|nr:hypothetical protein FQA39_LY19163 [Lamprigera yunnana]
MRFLLVLSYLTIVTCYLTIIEKNLNAKTCMKDVLKSVGTETTIVYVYKKVFKDILPEKLEHPLLTIDISKKIHRNSKYKIYNEIVILNLKNASLIQNYLRVLEQNGLWNAKSSFRRRYLIVYPSKKASELKNIFKYFFKSYIIDVIVMVHDLKGNTKMFTWDPYHPSNKCGTKFNMKTHSSCSLFKLSAIRRMQQFNKCNFTFAYYSDRETNRKKTRVAYVTGFILDEVSKNMNVTVILKYCPHCYPGELHLHLNSLKECESVTSCTAPFERSVYYWTVPQRKLIDPLEVFKIVFKTQVWILILLTFILTSVIWWLISLCTEKTNFTSALLKSIFTSNLVKLLTNVHYEPAIETLEQLAQSDLPIVMYAGSIGIFRNMERNDSLYMKIANKTHVVSWDHYMKSLFNETILEYNSVFLKTNLLQEMIINYNIKMRVISDDTLLGAHQYMFGTKIGSHLIKPAHKITTTLLEAGLINLKASEFNRNIKKFEYKCKGESNDNGNSREPKALSLTHVYPIFVIWGMGLICATAVFIMEHICHAIDKCSKKYT